MLPTELADDLKQPVAELKRPDSIMMPLVSPVWLHAGGHGEMPHAIPLPGSGKLVEVGRGSGGVRSEEDLQAVVARVKNEPAFAKANLPDLHMKDIDDYLAKKRGG